MGVLKINNKATSLLASSINTLVTSISVTASTGSRFPTLGAGDWFPVVVVDATGAIEIMRCTARSGDVLTVTRAQESTTAISFAAGARVDMRMTAAAFAALISDAKVVSDAFTTAAIAAAKVVSDAFTTAAVAAEATARNAAILAADNAVKVALRAEFNAPSGTSMMFNQTAAPTGWTKSTSFNDYALRITSGTVTSGGSVGFNTLFARTATDSHTLTESEMPTHTHSATSNVTDPGHTHPFTDDQVTGGAGGGGPIASGGPFQTVAVGDNTGSATTGISVNTTIGDRGSGGGHTHGLDMRLKFIEAILATKN